MSEFWNSLTQERQRNFKRPKQVAMKQWRIATKKNLNRLGGFSVCCGRRVKKEINEDRQLWWPWLIKCLCDWLETEHSIRGNAYSLTQSARICIGSHGPWLVDSPNMAANSLNTLRGIWFILNKVNTFPLQFEGFQLHLLKK